MSVLKKGSALFEIINLSTIWVLFNAYESDLPWIKKGDVVDFTLQSVPGKQFNGKVIFIDLFINAQTRVAQVRVELKNVDGQLKPEMFANGILKSSTAQNTKELLIPKSAILWTGKRVVVYVKVPDRETSSFIYRQIVLGPEVGNFYVVSEGLSEGEEIAMNGVFKIDAAAQLAGKVSMMNPDAGKASTGHNHGEMEMNATPEADHSAHSSSKAKKNTHMEHAMFKVSGNCEMCKETIETAVKSVDGIAEAEWNQKTKIMHVYFNSDKTALAKIHQAIAKAGYDTELEKANSDVYNKLPACCKYTRE